MSLYIEFEPHSWYKDFAIKDNRHEGHDQNNLERPLKDDSAYRWSAYTDNGMTGHIVERHANTLAELKNMITEYTNAEKARIERLYSRWKLQPTK